MGYGASGRNGSFGMTVVGLGFGTTAMLRGRQFVKEAHTYMERAADRMSELINVIPWPPEPLGSLAARGIRSYLRAEDWYYERTLV